MRWSENSRARPRPMVSPRLREKVEPRKEWAHLWAPGPACQHPAPQGPRGERGGGRKTEHAGWAGCGCQARGRARRGDQRNWGRGEAGGPAGLERRPAGRRRPTWALGGWRSRCAKPLPPSSAEERGAGTGRKCGAVRSLEGRKHCWSVTGHVFWIPHFSNTVDVDLNPKFPPFGCRGKLISLEMEMLTTPGGGVGWAYLCLCVVLQVGPPQKTDLIYSAACRGGTSSSEGMVLITNENACAEV